MLLLSHISGDFSVRSGAKTNPTNQTKLLDQSRRSLGQHLIVQFVFNRTGIFSVCICSLGGLEVVCGHFH